MQPLAAEAVYLFTGVPLRRPTAPTDSTAQPPNTDDRSNPAYLRRILISLIFLGMLMPLVASMLRVALPGLQAPFLSSGPTAL